MAEAQESRLSIVIDSADAEKRIKELRKQLRELGQQSDETGDNTDDLGRRIRNTSDSTGAFNRVAGRSRAAFASMAKAASLLGAAVGGIGFAAMLKTADAMQTLNNQIRVATDGVDEYVIAQSEIERIAMGTFSSLESVGQMYASNERALSSLGKSQTEVLLFTENISKAMAVSGGSAEAQAAALTQLGQAMASGVLRGDEFNSIAEQAPVIMDLLTESLGVTRGELRAMAADGALTAEIVYDAVSGASGRLDGMMGETVVTMSNAMTNVKTQWALLADGLINGEGGIGDGFASSIQKIAVALQDVRIWLDEFLSRAETIAFVEGFIDGLVSAWDALVSVFNSTEVSIAMSMILDALRGAWENLSSVVENAIDKLQVANQWLLEHEKTAGALKIFAAAIAIVGGAFVIYNTAVAIGAAVTGAFVGALALLSAPVALAVGVLVLLTAAGIALYLHWDTVKEKASQLASWLDGVFSGLPAPVQAALSTMATIVSSSMDAIFAVVQFVMDSVTAIWNGDWSALGGIAKTALSAIWSSISTILGSVLNTVKVILGSLLGVFTSILSSIWQGVVSRFNDMVSSASSALSNMVSAARAKMTEVKNAIVNTLKELPSRMLSIGREIIQGLINGIKSGASGVASAIGNVASSAIAKAKSVLDIHSPSRKMAKIGEQTAQGMAVGIKKGKKAVVTEAQKMAADAIKATQDAITGIDKELALFGNTSKVADIKYDISVGKFGGNTGALLAKATELESAKKMADIQSQLVAYSKMIYDNSTYLPSELTKISYELDEVKGRFYGASEASKELLRTGAALADQSKAEGVATGMMIDNLRELALLQTDGSDYAKLAYDLQDVSNALYVLDEATKQRLLTDELAIKAAKQTKASNDAITDSIESIDKQIALFGNNDAMEELLYDMAVLGKYAGASADNINKLFAATEKLAALNAEKAFKGVLDGNADDKSPIGKIMQEYDDKLAIIKAYEDSHTALLQESVAARLEVEGVYNDARSIMMLSSGEAVFGSLSGLAKNFLGEQSGTYKAMYALQKAFTLSSAIMSSKKAVMDAWANTPGGVWAKAFAAGKVILSTGAITKAIAGLAPQGFKQGGYTGNMGVNEIAGPVHGQEYVFDAQATKRIGVDNLNAMRSGKASIGGDVQVNIINNSSARVQASDDGKTITISDVRNEARNEAKRAFSNLQNPNSHESKMVNRNVQAPRRR